MKSFAAIFLLINGITDTWATKFCWENEAPQFNKSETTAVTVFRVYWGEYGFPPQQQRQKACRRHEEEKSAATSPRISVPLSMFLKQPQTRNVMYNKNQLMISKPLDDFFPRVVDRCKESLKNNSKDAPGWMEIHKALNTLKTFAEMLSTADKTRENNTSSGMCDAEEIQSHDRGSVETKVIQCKLNDDWLFQCPRDFNKSHEASSQIEKKMINIRRKLKSTNRTSCEKALLQTRVREDVENSGTADSAHTRCINVNIRNGFTLRNITEMPESTATATNAKLEVCDTKVFVNDGKVSTETCRDHQLHNRPNNSDWPENDLINSGKMAQESSGSEKKELQIFLPEVFLLCPAARRPGSRLPSPPPFSLFNFFRNDSSSGLHEQCLQDD